MAIQVKHATQATGTDAGNGEIRKAQWNEAHSISMSANTLLGRSSAGTGDAEEITIGSGLSLSGGVLAATGSSGNIDGGTPSSNYGGIAPINGGTP